MDALARSQVCQFHSIALHQDIFRFNIPMKYPFFMHELNSLKDLKHIEFDLLIGERIPLAFETLIEIHVHELKNQSKFTYKLGEKYHWVHHRELQ